MASFVGTSGNDSFIGADGVADVFSFTTANLGGNDTVQGGGGVSAVDRLTFLNGGSIGAAKFANVSGIERITLSNIGNSIVLTDALAATAVAGTLTILGNGLSGNDAVNGAALTAGRKLDFSSGAGNDTLAGGAGSDIFRFAAAQLDGADFIQGNGGKNTLAFATAGKVAAPLGENIKGISFIALNDGGNTLVINRDLGAGSLRVTGAAGNDTITSKTAIEIVAGAGKDTLTGSAASDSFTFNAANLTATDIVNGAGGNDTLAFATAGTVIASSLLGLDSIEKIEFSEAGNQIRIDAAAESANGVAFAVKGKAGSDVVDATGTTLGVRFTGWGGEDSFTGGAGDDVWVAPKLACLSFGDTFAAGAGDDILLVGGPGSINSIGVLAGFTGVDIITVSGSDNISMALQESFLDQTDAHRLTVNGGAGDDSVRAIGLTAENAVAVFGNDGDDSASFGLGNDTFDGGAGIDTVFYDGGSNLVVNLSITGAQNTGKGVDTLISVENAAFISASGTLIGSSAANALTGDKGIDTIEGGEGNDTISGGFENDVLRGQLGDDIITGGRGRDEIIGGQGADQFVFRNGDSATGDQRDVLNGFGQGADLFDFSGVGSAGDQLVFIGSAAFSNVAGQIRQLQSAGSTIVQVDTNGDSLADLEVGVLQLLTFTAADFIL